MATNYDPKINKFRNIRFRNANYPQMRLEGEARSLDAAEYAEIHEMKNSSKVCVASCLFSTLATQWLLARLAPFQSLNGYLRVISRVSLVAIPTGYAYYYMNERINARYNEMLQSKLLELYENPISMRYPAY